MGTGEHGSSGRRRRFARLPIAVALCLCGLLALGAGGASAAKKKGKKKPSAFSRSVAVNAAVPNGAVGVPSTPVTSTITVPNKFKGRVIGDLDVTALGTTGSGAGAAGDLSVLLTAPNGRTVLLFAALSGTSIGPLTLNDDTRTTLCQSPTPTCEDPNSTLIQPFAGTASMFDSSGGSGSGGTGPLSSFNGTRMNGTWTLQIWDNAAGPTSTFNSWGLVLKAAKPAKQTKGPTGFAGTVSPNAAVPDDAAAGPSTPLTSTITVPKKFKGKSVADLDLTGLTTTGSGAGAADDIRWRLSAPNGRSLAFNENTFGDVSIGPLTLDDDTKTSLCDEVTPICEGPYATLLRPFAGTANTLDLGTGGAGPLSTFNGLPMQGVWTLTVWDESSVGQTSTLNSWGLKLVAAKPAAKAAGAGAAAAAKKKRKKSPSNFAASAAVNAAVPNDVAVGPSTPLTSTITVPKKFKGAAVGDLNVTGIQTTGSGAAAARDLAMQLTAPNGRTMQLFNINFGDVSIGPLTLDDDVRTSTCDAPTPVCTFPNTTLAQPFAGTANTLFLGSQGTGPLNVFDGVRMNGTWTATIWDEAGVGTTSVFNGWGLQIRTAKPVK